MLTFMIALERGALYHDHFLFAHSNRLSHGTILSLDLRKLILNFYNE